MLPALMPWRSGRRGLDSGGLLGEGRSGSGEFGYGVAGLSGNTPIDRASLHNVRVMQRNLVYVIGLSPVCSVSLCHALMCAAHEFNAMC
jgi:hypothetical protein